METRYVKPLEGRLWGNMAAGHLARTGHGLDAILVSPDGIVWEIVRKCCGDCVPENMTPWNEDDEDGNEEVRS
ncbi:MAG: hypothetical protein IPG34_19625 [Rhodocyclaceae bacterium]|nr:hypothetical protein [Rhodocyclaceae bacterium]